MKTITTILSVFVTQLFFTSLLSAQNPTFEWAKQMGGTGYGRPASITTDNNGDIYTTGHFENTVDFDPNAVTRNLTSNGSHDIFIQKLSADGSLIWVKQMGGEGSDVGRAITTDDNGNVYTTGTFSGTVDFDPGIETTNLISKSVHSSFIQKLFNNGNLNWVKRIGGQKDDVLCLAIATDLSGNVYTTGSFYETVGFGEGTKMIYLNSAGWADIFIQKLDSTGALLWTKQMGGTDFESGTSITTDIDGNVYTTGYFNGTVDFDPGAEKANLTSNGDNDIFIQKLDAGGNFLWVKQMGGAGSDNATSITTDINGNVYTTGYFYETVDFNPGDVTANLTSKGNNDIFIQKLNAEGDFRWVKQMGGSSNDYSESITTDARGNVYTAGYFYDTVDFDPGGETANLISNGSSDIFIQKLDSLGHFQWVKQVGGTSEDRGTAIGIDDNGNIYTTGGFRETVDFGPGTGTTNLTSKGNLDVFILKLSQTTVGITQNTFTENIQVYPNPTTGNFAIKFETIQKDLSVRIMSIPGQTIENRIFQNTDFVELNLNQPDGIYLVVVLNEKGNSTGFRLIKK
jgi:hypothetical protein